MNRISIQQVCKLIHELVMFTLVEKHDAVKDVNSLIAAKVNVRNAIEQGSLDYLHVRNKVQGTVNYDFFFSCN